MNRCKIQQAERNYFKSQMRILKIKHTMSEMENSFNGIISRPNTAEKITKFAGTSIEIIQRETQR